MVYRVVGRGEHGRVGRGERAERTVKGRAKSAGRGLLWGGGTNDERRGLGCEGGARAGQMGRRGWGTRRAYLRCNFLPAFLLHGARAEARLGGNVRRACGTSGVGGGNEWEPGSGRRTRN